MTLLKGGYTHEDFKIEQDYNLYELDQNITNFETALQDYQSVKSRSGENNIKVEDLNRLPDDIEALSGRITDL